MTTNAPKPLVVYLTNSDNTFMVNGRDGYYARVTIRIEYTGSNTTTATNPETEIEYDSLTSTNFGILVYLIDNLTKPLYNVIDSTAGTWTGRAIVEYHRTTSDKERT